MEPKQGKKIKNIDQDVILQYKVTPKSFLSNF